MHAHGSRKGQSLAAAAAGRREQQSRRGARPTLRQRALRLVCCLAGARRRVGQGLLSSHTPLPLQEATRPPAPTQQLARLSRCGQCAPQARAALTDGLSGASRLGGDCLALPRALNYCETERDCSKRRQAVQRGLGHRRRLHRGPMCEHSAILFAALQRLLLPWCSCLKQ